MKRRKQLRSCVSSTPHEPVKLEEFDTGWAICDMLVMFSFLFDLLVYFLILADTFVKVLI